MMLLQSNLSVTVSCHLVKAEAWASHCSRPAIRRARSLAVESAFRVGSAKKPRRDGPL